MRYEDKNWSLLIFLFSDSIIYLHVIIELCNTENKIKSNLSIRLNAVDFTNLLIRN